MYGLQLPATIDEHQANLRAVAANYMRQVRAIQPSGPYHFAGHSSGGLVAFEIACQLREQGETVGLLALLDCDPDTGKSAHQPFRDWNSLKASFSRARAAFQLRDIWRARVAQKQNRLSEDQDQDLARGPIAPRGKGPRAG